MGRSDHAAAAIFLLCPSRNDLQHLIGQRSSSSHGARIQTLRSSSVVRICGAIVGNLQVASRADGATRPGSLPELGRVALPSGDPWTHKYEDWSDVCGSIDSRSRSPILGHLLISNLVRRGAGHQYIPIEVSFLQSRGRHANRGLKRRVKWDRSEKPQSNAIVPMGRCAFAGSFSSLAVIRRSV